jgi:hypothetical protein
VNLGDLSLRILSAAAVISAVGVACSTAAALQGAGGACEQATDCQEGFVCIDGGCADDLVGIQSVEEVGGEAAAPEAAPVADGTAGAETGATTDDSSPPPETGGSPNDAGPPAQDAPPEVDLTDVATE